jgi:hypothetical protein
MLFFDVEDLPGIAFAVAKMPVVKNQGVVSGLGKGFGIRVKAQFLDSAEAMGKNNAWRIGLAGGFEKPAPAF